MFEPTDNQLMRRLASGDTQALDILFRRHFRAAFALAARLTGDPVLSEDIVQNAFVGILRGATTFDDSGTFKTWMYRIVRNACVDQWRGAERRRKAVEGWGVREAGDASKMASNQPEPGPDADLIATLEAAMGQLTGAQREVLVLSRYHDLTYTEIADVTGCTPGAVKVRAHRAMKALRRAYFTLRTREVQA